MRKKLAAKATIGTTEKLFQRGEKEMRVAAKAMAVNSRKVRERRAPLPVVFMVMTHNIRVIRASHTLLKQRGCRRRHGSRRGTLLT